MLKKCPALLSLGLLLAVTFSTRVCAVNHTSAAPAGESSTLVHAAIILLVGAAAAYVVMLIMKRRKVK